jgi:hypothetical protein
VPCSLCPTIFTHLDFKSNYHIIGGYSEGSLSLRGGGNAIEEISAEGYEMDFRWDASEPNTPIRIYSWQGAVNAPLDYNGFLRQVDRVTSNGLQKDQFICLEVWCREGGRLLERVTGITHHEGLKGVGSDPVWELVKKHFKPDAPDSRACFVHAAVDDHPPSIEPQTRSDKYVVRIEAEGNGEVAYMRVPTKLLPEHRAHQFSMEYTRAMRLLTLSPEPHAWVSYQGGLIGDTFHDLDPPSELWDEVIDAKNAWGPLPTISFTLFPIDKDIVPVILPGYFRPSDALEFRRSDFTSSTGGDPIAGLNKLYNAIESVTKTVANMSRECIALEIWCPGRNFKSIDQKPTRLDFIGRKPATAQDWEKVKGMVPEVPFCVVVRPVYRNYRLHNADNSKTVSLKISQYDIASFKDFLKNRLYDDYNPETDEQVIVLGPFTKDSNQADMVIRADTTEAEWQWIIRNITDPTLTVSIKKISNGWCKYIGRDILLATNVALTESQASQVRPNGAHDLAPRTTLYLAQHMATPQLLGRGLLLLWGVVSLT